MKGDLDAAIADVTTSLRLDPSYTRAFTFRSMLYDKKGDKARAAADAEAAKK